MDSLQGSRGKVSTKSKQTWRDALDADKFIDAKVKILSEVKGHTGEEQLPFSD